jgi:hypothetical protein
LCDDDNSTGIEIPSDVSPTLSGGEGYSHLNNM